MGPRFEPNRMDQSSGRHESVQDTELEDPGRRDDGGGRVGAVGSTASRNRDGRLDLATPGCRCCCQASCTSSSIAKQKARLAPPESTGSWQSEERTEKTQTWDERRAALGGAGASKASTPVRLECGRREETPGERRLLIATFGSELRANLALVAPCSVCLLASHGPKDLADPTRLQSSDSPGGSPAVRHPVSPHLSPRPPSSRADPGHARRQVHRNPAPQGPQGPRHRP